MADGYAPASRTRKRNLRGDAVPGSHRVTPSGEHVTRTGTDSSTERPAETMWAKKFCTRGESDGRGSSFTFHSSRLANSGSGVPEPALR